MITAGFGDVTAPVLALMGSEPDMWSDLDDAEIDHRVALFADARWHRVEGAGHYVHVEQPEVVVDAIAAFLDEIEVRDAGRRP